MCIRDRVVADGRSDQLIRPNHHPGLRMFESAIEPVREPAISTARKLRVGGLGRLLPGFVLERDAKLRPISDPAVLGDMDVLCDNLGDPDIAQHPARRLDGNGCGVLPGLRTCSDEVCHTVNAHATLLAIRMDCLPETVLPDSCSRRQEVRGGLLAPMHGAAARVSCRSSCGHGCVARWVWSSLCRLVLHRW